MTHADAAALLVRALGEPDVIGDVAQGPPGRELVWGDAAVLLFEGGVAYVLAGDDVVARAGWTTRAGVMWLGLVVRGLIGGEG